MTDEHLALNRALWDDRAPAHAASDDYDLRRYLDDPDALSDVVRFDLPRLGDVRGLDVLHLQCHIGTDTLSLHRLGARVTGLDLSPASLQEAARLAERTGATIPWVEADVYDAPAALDGATFDLVYTGIGAIIWLPDIDRWAATVAALLRLGGRLVMREGHPMLGTLEVVDGRLEQRYPYFHQAEPLMGVPPHEARSGGGFSGEDTYVQTEHPLADLASQEWTHGVGEVVTALLDHGLRIASLTEHDSVPWPALAGLMAPHPDHPGELRLAAHPERLAASYTVTAVKD